MKYAEKQRGRFPCTEFHTRKTASFLISIIQFFIEPVDFLLVFGDTVHLHTAQNHCGNTTAEQKTDQKVQHSFIT